MYRYLWYLHGEYVLCPVSHILFWLRGTLLLIASFVPLSSPSSRMPARFLAICSLERAGRYTEAGAACVWWLGVTVTLCCAHDWRGSGPYNMQIIAHHISHNQDARPPTLRRFFTNARSLSTKQSDPFQAASLCCWLEESTGSC